MAPKINLGLTRGDPYTPYLYMYLSTCPYTAIGQHFQNQGLALSNFTIKFHYLLHLAHICEYINVRLAWCYSGEDLMHVVKTLVQSSHRGCRPSLVPAKVMRKYTFGLGLHLNRRRWGQ